MDDRMEKSVQELFRTAVAHSDPAVMGEGLERLLGVTDGQGLSAHEEYQLRSHEFVMEMPSRASGSVAGTR